MDKPITRHKRPWVSIDLEAREYVFSPLICGGKIIMPCGSENSSAAISHDSNWRYTLCYCTIFSG